MIEREGKVRGVLEGRGGRLFLGDQDGFALDWFLSAKPFNRSLLEVWKRTLRRRARELKRRGIPYIFYLAPDAHYVYPEDLPAGHEAAAGQTPPGTTFLGFMSELKDIAFVDPRPDLLAAKGALEIYRKTDSHWTQYGSFIAYKTLCRALQGVVPVSELQARDVAFEYRRFFGDLGVLVEPERSEETVRARTARNPYVRIYENDGFDRTGCFETLAADAIATRVLLFRDSFMTDQFDYIGRSFRHVLCAGTTTSLFLDEIDAWKPRAVISHVGERRLYSYELDHRQDTFDDVFRTYFGSPRGRLAQKAMLLLGARRPADALAHITEFEADPALRPDHAYVAAQVLRANSLDERAWAAVNVALRSYPTRPSYLSLAAKIQLALGGLREALDLVGRALETASYNGHYHETFCYLLLAKGEAAAARRYLDAALVEIDDYGVLWYLQSLACEALGDRSGAIDAIVEALRLDSNEATFQTQAIKLWGT